MLEIDKILSNEDLVNLVGSSKQIENFYNNNSMPTNVKKSLLKQLSRYCEFEEIKINKKSHYKILKINEVVKDKVDKRINNGSSQIKFTDHLETSLALAILNGIKKEFCEYDLEKRGYDYDMPYFTITNTKLMLEVGLANETYKRFKNKTISYNKEKKCNHNQTAIDIAFRKVKNLSSNMHSALNRLKNKHKLINIADCFVAKGERKNYMYFNNRRFIDDENPVIQYNEIWLNGNENYNKVKQIEKQVLIEMNAKTKEELDKCKKEKYDKEVNKRLKMELGVDAIIKANKITVLNIEWLENFIKDREDLDISKIINSMSAYNILVENLKNRNNNNYKSRLDRKIKFLSKNSICKDGFDNEEEKDIMELALKEIEKEAESEIKIYEDLVKIIVDNKDVIKIAKEKCYKEKGEK